MTETITPYLRDRTRHLHARLEETVDIAHALSTRERYRALLECFYGFHAALEPELIDHPGWTTIGFPMADRVKLPSLRQDLLDLGATAADLEALLRCASLPALDRFSRALGCAYVLEGSTLGGQVVARQLDSIGVDSEWGGHYFSVYGASTGRMWADFRAMLDRQSASADREEIVAGAVETFLSLDRWFRVVEAERH